MKDFRGTQITVGCQVAYGVKTGSWQAMHVGEVVEIKRVPHRWTDDKFVSKLKLKIVSSSDSYEKPGRLATIECIDRVVVVT